MLCSNAKSRIHGLGDGFAPTIAPWFAAHRAVRGLLYRWFLFREGMPKGLQEHVRTSACLLGPCTNAICNQIVEFRQCCTYNRCLVIGPVTMPSGLLAVHPKSEDLFLSRVCPNCWRLRATPAAQELRITSAKLHNGGARVGPSPRLPGHTQSRTHGSGAKQGRVRWHNLPSTLRAPHGNVPRAGLRTRAGRPTRLEVLGGKAWSNAPC